MDDDRRLAKRVELIETLENPVCYVAAGVVALLYFLWRWNHHVIATYSWSIPFVGVLAICKFAFAIAGSRAEQALRAYRDGPGLPAARVVAQSPPAAPEPQRVPLVAPERAPDPPKAGEPPRLLR